MSSRELVLLLLTLLVLDCDRLGGWLEADLELESCMAEEEVLERLLVSWSSEEERV